MAKGSFRFPLYASSPADPNIICPADGWIKPESPYPLPVPVPTPASEELVFLCSNEGDKVVSFRLSTSPVGNSVYEIFDVAGNLLNTETLGSTTNFVMYFSTYPGHDYLIIKARPEISGRTCHIFRNYDVSGYSRNWPILFADFSKAPNLSSLSVAFQSIKLLQRIDFPSTLNNLGNIGSAFQDTLIPWIKWPSALPSLTSSGSVFRYNSALYTNYFPKDCPSNTGMSYMYQNCTSLQEHEMPGNLQNVGSMRDYLNGCSNLNSLKLATNMQDATLFTSFLRNCSKLLSKLVFPPLPNATTFYGMFWGCSKLPYVEFTGPSDSSTNCYNIASACAELTYFKFPSSMAVVDTFQAGFNGCVKLKKIVMPDYLGYNGQINMDALIGGCTELSEIDGTMECSANTYIYLRQLASTGGEKIATFNKPLAKFSYLDLGKSGGQLSYVEVDWASSPWTASLYGTPHSWYHFFLIFN